MEFLTALFTILIVMLGYKYRKAIGRWLNDPRSDAAYFDIKVLKKYGIEDAAKIVKAQRRLEDVENEQFQKDD